MTSSNFGVLEADAASSDHAVLIERGCDEAIRQWRRSEFDAACDGVARGLVRAGIGTGDRIAIAGMNSARYLTTVFGAMRCGAVPVPLNIKLPASQLCAVIRDADARMVFADHGFADLAPEVGPVVTLDQSGFDDFCVPGAFDAIEPSDDHPALQLYTSGSSGTPKGVLLSHRGKLWTVRAYTPPGNTSGLRGIAAGPLYHKNAFLLAALALRSGGAVVVLPRFDAVEYLRAAAEHRLTVLGGVPTMFSLILDQSDLISRLDLSSVRRVMVGSAPLSDVLCERIQLSFPSAEITNNYGTTEASAVFGPHPGGKPRPAGSLGALLPGVQARLAGETPDRGVLQVRSPGVMLGYHARPDLTAEKLVDGWYDTGDVLRRDEDGFFSFVGRADDMFVCGGENIYPAAVESVVERCPGVVAASVIGVPDERKGAVPFAFVVLSSGMSASADEIKTFFLANGPAYAHPRYVTFLDQLPRTGTDKIDRKTLERLAAVFLSLPGDQHTGQGEAFA